MDHRLPTAAPGVHRKKNCAWSCTTRQRIGIGAQGSAGHPRLDIKVKGTPPTQRPAVGDDPKLRATGMRISP